MNAIAWRFAISSFHPELLADSALQNVQSTTAWILRSADIKVKPLNLNLSSGLGLSQVSYWTENSYVHAGAIAYRVDLTQYVFSFSGMDFNLGVSYKGAVIPHTTRYTDRFGLGIQMVSSKGTEHQIEQ